ncbi:hypothetical protein [Micromonospora sp. NBRC 101691]|uniref:hypothetical protein n=1 Tax=Micromonospora sp. NBRC 101691 TaxID=3032198 RepID=UPI0024A22559|nr:hypothetical protein [Micromonospora sp. NBRC 101691]GLY25935.1 hypothetical protein Misp04_56660 [Micromonospora sp. NBRC 101691]
MTDAGTDSGPVIRKLSFFGSGSRPARTIDTPHGTYPVARASAPTDGPPAGDGEPKGCLFYRPGCPCGVPF